MKRNKQLARAARKARTSSGKSRYADKRERNEMTYGPGCCAHNRVLKRRYDNAEV